jgi:hypothetical protein
VNVENTTGILYVENPGGKDSVYVGSYGSAPGGNVQGINGAVTVFGAGGTNLSVDDSGDSTGRTATLSNSPFIDGFLGAISGLAPANISWVPTSSATGGVTGLKVYGGTGSNTFNVANTSNFSFFDRTYLYTSSGNNTVNVENTTGRLSVDNLGGQASVYVGSNGSALGGNVQGINGFVYVSGSGGTSLTVDDSGDSTGRTAKLFEENIIGLAPAPIDWTPTSSATGGVTSLNVYGGSGGNTFKVTGTSNFYNETLLSTGTGNDTVNVEATTGALYIQNPGGQDSVYVGSNGSALGGNVQGINGAVTVLGPGDTVLTVDDSGDSTGRTATLSNSPFAFGSFIGAVSGLAPAPIQWIPTNRATGGVTGLTVYGGSGGNTFKVTGTSNFYNETLLSTGTGNDTVNVEATTGALYVQNPGGQDSVYVGSNGSALGGNVQGINGAVTVLGPGDTVLTVDDSGDSTGRTATLSNSPFAFGSFIGAVTGLAPAPIEWIPAGSTDGGVTGLTVYGGSGGNTFTITGTSNFSNATTLSTGTGNDTVNVEATTGLLSVNNSGGQDSVYVGSKGSVLGGNVQGINGEVIITGAGATALTVDDGGDTTGRTATLFNVPFVSTFIGGITGLAPANIEWIPAGSPSGDVTGLTVYGGSGGNTFNVAGTSNFSTTLNTGTGNNTVNVEATTGALSVNNSGGQDSVYVGSNGSALGGNVQGINGEVIITGAGATALTVDNGGDTTGRTATLASGPFFSTTLGLITGLAPANILWIPAGSPSGDVTGLTVYGGSGGNTFNVAGCRPG